nr:hypothetical protein [Xanthomonas citri]
MAQHHEALVGHGFTHAHIVALSQHPAALGTVAVKYQDMIAALPEATHEAIVGVGKQWSGARALEALLTVAGELRGPPLQLDTGQLLKIAKRGGVTAVEAVHAWRNALTGAPPEPDPEQVVAIASMGARAGAGGRPGEEQLAEMASRRWRRCSGCCRCCAGHGLPARWGGGQAGLGGRGGCYRRQRWSHLGAQAW